MAIAEFIIKSNTESKEKSFTYSPFTVTDFNSRIEFAVSPIIPKKNEVEDSKGVGEEILDKAKQLVGRIARPFVYPAEVLARKLLAEGE